MSEVCGGCHHSKFAHRLGPCMSDGCKCKEFAMPTPTDGKPFMICRLCGTTFSVCEHIESGYVKLQDENKKLKIDLEAAERRVKDLEYSVRLARETLPDLGEAAPEPGSLATKTPDELERVMDQFKDSYPALHDMLKRMERRAQKTALFGFLYGTAPEELKEAVNKGDLERVKALIDGVPKEDYRRYAKQASFTEGMFRPLPALKTDLFKPGQPRTVIGDSDNYAKQAAFVEEMEMKRAQFGEPRPDEIIINADDEVEKVWQLHWMPLLETAATREKTSIKDQIKRELFDYGTLLDSIPKVYSEVTGGKVSKPNTKPDAVIELFQELMEQERQLAVEDAFKEAAQEHTSKPTKIERIDSDRSMHESWVVLVFDQFYLSAHHGNEESAKQQEKAFLEALIGFEKAMQTPPGMAHIPITPEQHAMLASSLIFMKNGEWKPTMWGKDLDAVFKAVRDSIRY